MGAGPHEVELNGRRCHAGSAVRVRSLPTTRGISPVPSITCQFGRWNSNGLSRTGDVAFLDDQGRWRRPVCGIDAVERLAIRPPADRRVRCSAPSRDQCPRCLHALGREPRKGLSIAGKGGMSTGTTAPVRVFDHAVGRPGRRHLVASQRTGRRCRRGRWPGRGANSRIGRSCTARSSQRKISSQRPPRRPLRGGPGGMALCQSQHRAAGLFAVAVPGARRHGSAGGAGRRPRSGHRSCSRSTTAPGAAGRRQRGRGPARVARDAMRRPAPASQRTPPWSKGDPAGAHGDLGEGAALRWRAALPVARLRSSARASWSEGVAVGARISGVGQGESAGRPASGSGTRRPRPWPSSAAGHASRSPLAIAARASAPAHAPDAPGSWRAVPAGDRQNERGGMCSACVHFDPSREAVRDGPRDRHRRRPGNCADRRGHAVSAR